MFPMTKQDRKQLYKLIEQWTRATIISRYTSFEWIKFGDAHFTAIQKEDEIRKLMYGTSDLVELGYKWGLPIHIMKEKKINKNNKNMKKKKKHLR